MKFIVDASVFLRSYVGGPYISRAEQVMKTLLEYPGLFAVPELVSYEVLNGLYQCSPYAAEIFELEGFWLTFDSKAHALLEGENVSVDLTEGLPEGWE